MKAGSGQEKLGGLLHEPGAETLDPSSRIPLPSPPGVETCPPDPRAPRYPPAAAGTPAPELVVGLGLRVPRMGDGGGHSHRPGVGTGSSGQVGGAPAGLRSWEKRLSLSAHWGNILSLAGTVPSPPASSILDGSKSLSGKSSSQPCSKRNCLPG